MMLFKKKFREAIRAGTKTQTIRLWRQQFVRPGEVHRIPGTGYVRVTAVSVINLEDLTESDAAADGFTALADLKAEIRRIYGDGAARGRRCFRIQFQYLGEQQPTRT